MRRTRFSRDAPALVERGVEEDRAEGRAAVARDVVVAAQPRAQHGRDLAQHLVAGTAVQPLVDPAEVVRAEQEQDGGALLGLHVRERGLELGLELRRDRAAP